MAIRMNRTERSTYFKTTLTSYVRKQHEMHCILQRNKHCAREKSTKYRRNGNNRNPIGTLMQVVTQTCVARFLLHDFIERTMRQRLSVYENVTGLSCCVQHAGKSASQNYLLNVYYWDVEKLSLVPTQESVCEWRATFQDRFFFYLGVSFIFLSHFVLFFLLDCHS